MRLRSFLFAFVLVAFSSLLLGLGQAQAQVVTDRCLGGSGAKCISPVPVTERLAARLNVYKGYPDGVPHILGFPSGASPSLSNLTIDIQTTLIPGVGLQSRSLRVKIPGLVASGANSSPTAALAYRARIGRISGHVTPSTGSCGRVVRLSAQNVTLLDTDVQYDDTGEAFVDIAIDARQEVCLQSR